MFILMLTLMTLCVANVNAQVTIGSENPPHSGAVLDLQSGLGLKLPTVELGDVTVFQLLEEGDTEIETATGLMVYNSSDETIGGNGKGIYVWTGKWVSAGKSAPVETSVTNINITSADYATELKASGVGSTLQLTAEVLPVDADNKTVTWTQVYNPATTAGKVTIDATGLVTGIKAGNVTVRVAATDGSGVYRDIALIVKPSSLVTNVTITTANTAPSVELNSQLQLIATVAPLTAQPIVLWTTTDPSIAVVDATNGIVTPRSTGSTDIVATAIDGSNSSGNITITVTSPLLLPTTPAVISGETYQTVVVAGKTWTVEPMRHGTARWYEYSGDDSKPAYYYSYDQAQEVCTDGFRLPTESDAAAFINYVNIISGSLRSTISRPETLTGERNSVRFLGWGEFQTLWFIPVSPISDTRYYHIPTAGKLDIGTSGNWPSFGLPVRCMHD
ncbi:hypothetical protein FACS189421_06150 [Bacteroidia bacterium]|nr:hypothetical protein FACS189421_06150 [Bacteroidia bacterium]